MLRSRLLVPLAVLAVVVPLASCSDDGSAGPGDRGGPSSAAPARTDGFTLTRADGSSVEVGPFTVECLEGDDTDPRVVRAATSFYTGGAESPQGGYLEFEPSTIPDDGVTYDVPLEGVVGSMDYDTRTVFFYDGETELSASEEGGAGTVRVLRATCDPEPRLVVAVQATIGSETFEGGTVEVTGGLDLTGSS